MTGRIEGQVAIITGSTSGIGRASAELFARELGVRSFDTGFPVDFGALRRALGPEVEIWGGVEVATLLHGTPEQVYARARDIPTSGVLEGKRFVLREANNLPPRVPLANLEAMYRAAFDFGRYES